MIQREPTAASILQELQRHRNPAQESILRRFFKTGPGEYGEGDQFWGLTVPQVRSIVKSFPPISLPVADDLLASPVHEARFFALAALVLSYAKGSSETRQSIFDFYLSHSPRINNWDLVDLSAPRIVGKHLPPGKGHRILGTLMKSSLLWDRRIAMISTLEHIRQGNLDNTFWLAEKFLTDPEDLMHKAAGWMLREAGKSDEAALTEFIRLHVSRMPRTMLRYAIERFAPEKRKAWLNAR